MKSQAKYRKRNTSKHNFCINFIIFYSNKSSNIVEFLECIRMSLGICKRNLSKIYKFQKSAVWEDTT